MCVCGTAVRQLLASPDYAITGEMCTRNLLGALAAQMCELLNTIDELVLITCECSN